MTFLKKNKKKSIWLHQVLVVACRNLVPLTRGLNLGPGMGAGGLSCCGPLGKCPQVDLLSTWLPLPSLCCPGFWGPGQASVEPLGRALLAVTLSAALPDVKPRPATPCPSPRFDGSRRLGDRPDFVVGAASLPPLPSPEVDPPGLLVWWAEQGSFTVQGVGVYSFFVLLFRMM